MIEYCCKYEKRICNMRFCNKKKTKTKKKEKKKKGSCFA